MASPVLLEAPDEPEGLSWVRRQGRRGEQGDLDLLAEEQVPKEEAPAAAADAGEGCEEEPEQFDHRGKMADRRHLAGRGADFCPPRGSRTRRRSIAALHAGAAAGHHGQRRPGRWTTGRTHASRRWQRSSRRPAYVSTPASSVSRGMTLNRSSTTGRRQISGCRRSPSNLRRGPEAGQGPGRGHGRSVPLRQAGGLRGGLGAATDPAGARRSKPQYRWLCSTRPSREPARDYWLTWWPSSPADTHRRS